MQGVAKWLADRGKRRERKEGRRWKQESSASNKHSIVRQPFPSNNAVLAAADLFVQLSIAPSCIRSTDRELTEREQQTNLSLAPRSPPRSSLWLPSFLLPIVHAFFSLSFFTSSNQVVYHSSQKENRGPIIVIFSLSLGARPSR